MKATNLLNEYELWIDKNIPNESDWDEELNYMAFLRQQIHEDLENIDTEKLRSLDKRWQSQLRMTLNKDFTFSYPRSNMPRSNWWAWIDQIDKLSEAELSTL
jgi:hypothetical protein